MSSQAQSEYNRRNYQKNKAKILERRRLRYRKDREYREGILRRSRVRSFLNKAKKMATIPTVTHGGRLERRMTMSDLCEKTNRHKTVFHRLRRNGIMPMPVYRDEHQRYVYSESQVYLMEDLFRLIDDGADLSYDELRQILFSLWDETYRPSDLTLAGFKERVNSGEKESSRAARSRVRRARRESNAGASRR